MVSIIGRKYTNSAEYKLSVRVNNSQLKTAVALGVTVDENRWNYISTILKDVRVAYKKKASIFINDPLAEKLWEIIKLCLAKELEGTLTTKYIDYVSKNILYEKDITKIKQIPSTVIKNKTKPTLFEYFEIFLNELKIGKRTKIGSSEKVSLRTYYTFSSVYRSLLMFCKKNHTVYDWDDMTVEWAMNYKEFLIKQNKSANTISLYFTQIKAFLKAANLQKYTTINDFNSKAFSSSKVDVNTIALTEDEIKKIYSLEIKAGMSLDNLRTDPNVKKEEIDNITNNWIDKAKHCRWLEETRDAFVMACLIGQRFSDFKRIEQDMIVTLEGKPFIHITQIKTKKEIYIPCPPLVTSLLSKYKKFPRFYNEIFNRRIKIVCLMAGLTNIPNIGSREGIIKENTTMRVCDLVSTHTARRSFATNAYKRNVPLSSIMAITGHKTEATLRKYIKLDSQEQALKAAKDFEGITNFI